MLNLTNSHVDTLYMYSILSFLWEYHIHMYMSMIAHISLVAGNLPIKTLVAR